jgi:hypothetical protein
MPRARKPGSSSRKLVRSSHVVEPERVDARPLLPAGDVDFGSTGPRRTEVGLSSYALHEGTPVILFLRDPRDKIWGLLVSLGASGVVVRGMDLRTFEEWLRQEARRDDDALGPATLFYPMHRVERMERDESVGMVISFSDRFFREVGRTVNETMGIG